MSARGLQTLVENMYTGPELLTEKRPLTQDELEKMDESDTIVGNGKRLANYIFSSLYRVLMMNPSYIDRQGIHHGTELIEKRSQPPALA